MARPILIGFFCRWHCPNGILRTFATWSKYQRSYPARVLPFPVPLRDACKSAQSVSALSHVTHSRYTTRRSYSKKGKSQNRLNEDEAEVIDLEGLEKSMQAAVKSLKHEYTMNITTRITPAALDRVSVEIEGQSYPLKQVAQIGMPNPSLMVINLSSYPQAVNSTVNTLRNLDINLSPIPEKNAVKVPIPKVSKELRQKLVKMAKAQAEKTKVGIRKARQKGITEIKRKSDVSKDTVRKLEKHVQELTDKHTGEVDEMLKAKTNELIKGS